jgi:Flp pilus assembly protein TadD
MDSARVLLERERRLHPQRHRTYINLASWHLLEGSPDSARNAAAEAVRLAPWDATANRVWLRSLAADSMLAADSLAREVNLAGQRTGDNIYVLLEGASLLAARQAWSQAEAVLRRALTSVPPPIETDDEAFSADFPNSRSAWREQKALAHYLLGYTAGQQHHLGEAINHSRRAAELNPDLAEAYVNLANALRLAGRAADADSVRSLARRRFPDHPLIDQIQ